VKKVFIDTDIILDLLLQRDPFFVHALELFRRIESGEFNAHVSALIVWNIYYLVEKYSGKKKAHQKVTELRALLKIIPVDEKIIDLSLQSDFKEFEDSIQYFAAKSKNITTIITRNKKDYRTGDIALMTALEFLSAA